MNLPRAAAAVGAVAIGVAIVGIAVADDDDGSTAEPDATVETVPPTGAPSDTAPGESASEDPAAEPADSSTDTPTSTDPVVEDAPDLPDRGVHPELQRIDGWLQSDVTSLEELRGSVVAVQFWTFGCINCRNTLPHMQALYEDYGGEDFEIVGIHAPEFEYEAEVDNIVDAAAELGVTWPIALDPTKRTFHSWQEGPTGHWPRIYLLDRDGHVRYDHIGEGRYDEIDAAVRALLAEPS